MPEAPDDAWHMSLSQGRELAISGRYGELLNAVRSCAIVRLRIILDPAIQLLAILRCGTELP